MSVPFTLYLPLWFPFFAASTGFGGFGALGQTGVSTGFGLTKPTTAFGATGAAAGTSFGAWGAQPAQQQQAVQLTR